MQVVIFDLMLLHSASNVITNTPRHVLFSSESEPLSSPSALCPPPSALAGCSLLLPRDQSRRMNVLSSLCRGDQSAQLTTLTEMPWPQPTSTLPQRLTSPIPLQVQGASSTHLPSGRRCRRARGRRGVV